MWSFHVVIVLGRQKNWRQERNQAVALPISTSTWDADSCGSGFWLIHYLFLKLVSQLPSLSRRTKGRYATRPFQFSQHVKQKVGKKSLPYRVVTRDSDQGSKGWDRGSKARDQRSKLWVHESEASSGINAALDLTNRRRTLTPKIMFYPNETNLPSEMFSWTGPTALKKNRGTAIYGLYRYVPLWRVWFSSSLL